jgi:hypothetical protein
MSSSLHLETDGLTEHVNITFQQLLHCFCCYAGLDRAAMLPFVEFAFLRGQPNMKLRDRQLVPFHVEEHIGKHIDKLKIHATI